MSEVNEQDCFGDYPDNECDRSTCKDMCPDIEACKKGTESGDEES